MSQHTPGPWRVASASDYPSGINVDARERGYVALVGHPGDSEAQANARLIASAPDLLEQLTQTVRALEFWFPHWGDPDGVNSQMMSNAREAIAKAEGRGEK